MYLHIETTRLNPQERWCIRQTWQQIWQILSAS